MDKSYWNNRYADKTTGWDLGEVSPPIKAYFDQLTDKNLRILIPGCGNAYEALYAVQQGFANITVIDIAPLAVENLKENLADYQNVKVILGDFFEHQGQYDLVIEQTFFCAIHPTLRLQYVEKMSELLAPNGKIVGLLFGVIFEKEGPPFGGTIDEYVPLFSRKFDLAILESAKNSVKPRSGTELFIKFVTKN